MPVGGAGATVTVTGAKADFIERMKVAAKITGQIARVVPTTRKSETFPILGQVAQLVQWTDERADDDVYETSVTITPKHWGAGLPIHRDTYDDDQVGGYAELIRGLSQRAADFPTKRLLKDVIDAAYSNSTFGNAYDGQSFFDTDHADPGPATYTTSQDNDLTGTAATSTTPTVAEVHTALDAIEEQFRSFKDSRGEPWHADLTSIDGNGGLIILTPPDMWGPVTRAVRDRTLADNVGAAGTGANNVARMGQYTLIQNPWTVNNERIQALRGNGAFFLLTRAEARFQQVTGQGSGEVSFEAYNRLFDYYGVDLRLEAGLRQWRDAVSYIWT